MLEPEPEPEPVRECLDSTERSDPCEHYLRRELYQRVRSDEAIFEFLQDGSLDGLWYWDLEHPEHEWMSPAFWTTLGYDPAKREHLAAEWQDLIHPEDLQVALRNLRQHCADPDHPYDQVVRYRHKRGDTVWIRCRGVAIRDEGGRPVRILGAHTDITSLKRVEEELRRRTAELEQALDRIRRLRELLPICCVCKKIRDDAGDWHQLESYLREQTGTSFTHGYCPRCLEDAEDA